MFTPSNINLYKNGILENKSDKLIKKLSKCDICPHKCGVNRLKNEKGFCKTGRLARVCSFSPHHGEESPISGFQGSGTIFFSECNMKCDFCQNYDISQLGYGHEANKEELAGIMLKLQSRGCHNINFVSPTHVVPQVVESLLIAVENGLVIPLVYNTGGYDSVETLELIEGIFDIYMPDMKYGDTETGYKYSKIKDYPGFNQSAVKEMHRQVGDLKLNSKGIAEKGLLIRHLIMPENLAKTELIMQFLSEKISTNTYINIMDQYHPCYNSRKYPKLSRRITMEEYKKAVSIAESYGLHRFDR